jgi:malate dehydrogenase (oxaloacetate-decarboxylating)(NADP+)
MNEKALDYHKKPLPGKISVVPSKRCETQEDLSLAYTPGVAVPCLEIEKDNLKAYDYTSRGNLVGVVTDGSAVLGLGDIGPLAGKPVMEGKSVLFKMFGGVDAFDIEIDERDPDSFIKIVKSLEPTFGGINLEDIASPRCFYIEEELKKIMNIPVFHDDQHGTAVICAAGVLNALEISGKKPEKCKVVISGAGAAAIAIAKHLIALGFDNSLIYGYDREGVLYKGRANTKSKYHEFLFRETDARSMEDLLEGCDVFLGLSVKDLITGDMIKKMSADPVIFPMANPDPEIPYNKIMESRPDAFAGTGRSDFPNQVNNVLGFPAIFRGALDIRATDITQNMKIAATKALMNVTKMEVPQYVLDAYGHDKLEFGRDYLIPKPFDKRVAVEVASFVAEAGIKDGVNRIDLDIENYRKELERRFCNEK